MNIYILSIPAHILRVAVTLGHLATLGFPINYLMEKHQLKIFNGFDYRGNFDAFCQQMTDDGFEAYGNSFQKDRYKTAPMSSDEMQDGERLHRHLRAVDFGFAQILKRIAEGESPTLLIVSDIFFDSEKFNESILEKRWSDLKAKVGYKNINVAMLAFNKHPRNSVTPIDNFWAEGSLSGGDQANIWTPHGARYFLDLGISAHIETYLAQHPEMPGLYTTTKGLLEHAWHSHIDARTSEYTMPKIDATLQGISLCQPGPNIFFDEPLDETSDDPYKNRD